MCRWKVEHSVRILLYRSHLSSNSEHAIIATSLIASPHNSLKLHCISNTKLLCWRPIVCFNDIFLLMQDEEELADLQARAEESRKISSVLTAYGLRSDLALHLEDIAMHEPILENSDEEELRLIEAQGSNSVWAVLLYHILTLPTDSIARQSICQALHLAPGWVLNIT